MNFQEVMALAKRRGILQPAYEPYGGVAGFLDYGPVGVRLRRKITELWREHIVLGFGALEIDSARIGPEPLFRASGHLSEFDDLLVECLECNKLYRADLLVEGEDALDRRILANAVAGKKCESCGGKFDVAGAATAAVAMASSRSTPSSAATRASALPLSVFRPAALRTLVTDLASISAPAELSSMAE